MPEMKLENAQQILKEIARERGLKVAPCEDFDPNVCTFTQDPKDRTALVARSGQPFVRKTTVKIGELRVRLSANDDFLRIMVPGELGMEPVAVNRADKITHLKPAGDITLGGRNYPVFTRNGVLPGDDSGMPREDLLRFLKAAKLGSQESVHLYGNGMAVYLFQPSTARANRIMENAAITLSRMTSAPAEKDFSRLPSNFTPLLPLLHFWGSLNEEEREERLKRAARPALQAIVTEVKPYLPAIDSYLDQFGKDPLPEEALALATLAEFAVETERYLKRE